MSFDMIDEIWEAAIIVSCEDILLALCAANPAWRFPRIECSGLRYTPKVSPNLYKISAEEGANLKREKESASFSFFFSLFLAGEWQLAGTHFASMGGGNFLVIMYPWG